MSRLGIAATFVICAAMSSFFSEAGKDGWNWTKDFARTQYVAYFGFDTIDIAYPIETGAKPSQPSDLIGMWDLKEEQRSKETGGFSPDTYKTK